jgi:hypothetical protein
MVLSSVLVLIHPPRIALPIANANCYFKLSFLVPSIRQEILYSTKMFSEFGTSHLSTAQAA